MTNLIQGLHVLVTDKDGIPVEQNDSLLIMNTKGK